MLATSFCILLLSIVSHQTAACPPIDLPSYATMNCSWTGPGIKECRFTCEWKAEMTGRAEITCQRGADNWDRPTPICSLDPVECKGKDKKACLNADAELLEQFEAHRKFLSEEEKEAIRQIRSAYRGSKLRRSGTMCYTWMCSIKCPFLAPNKHLVKRCNKCKNKKIINCSRSGSLFG